ncbi:hypothetical protein OBV_30060 [Oscillibacter valericigenes Sjm18-20]|nr:hypothetical protein OBV_30060 [Oscillibacter valericigenes Sjm18-20]
MPFCRDSVAKVCPYGIITTNRKSPIYQGLEDLPPAFSSFSIMKKKLAKTVITREVLR